MDSGPEVANSDYWFADENGPGYPASPESLQVIKFERRGRESLTLCVPAAIRRGNCENHRHFFAHVNCRVPFLSGVANVLNATITPQSSWSPITLRGGLLHKPTERLLRGQISTISDFYDKIDAGPISVLSGVAGHVLWPSWLDTASVLKTPREGLGTPRSIFCCPQAPARRHRGLEKYPVGAPDRGGGVIAMVRSLSRRGW